MDAVLTLTHSLTHSFTHSLIHSLIQSVNQSITVDPFSNMYGLILTHLLLVPHIWVSIGSDNGLSPIRRQAII